MTNPPRAPLVGGVPGGVLDSLVDLLSGQWWSYALLLGLCVLDVVLPILPSESAVITGGIVAAQGGMILWLVVVAATVGAWSGDNLAYTIGDKAQDWARRWIVRGEKGQRGLRWAERTLDRHGGSLVIVARFVPGGRTVTTISCGTLGYPRRRFMAFDAVGAVTWASVNALVGYFGGRAFKDRTLLAFAVSFGIALLVAGCIELGRAVYRRSRRRQTTRSADR